MAKWKISAWIGMATILSCVVIKGKASAFECGGVVTIHIHNGIVRLTGDDAPNCIHVVDDPTDAGFAIYGLNGTLIDTTTARALIPIEQVRSVSIDLGKGDDRLDANYITGTQVRWKIRGGGGADFLAFGSIALDQLMLDGGDGDDTLVLSKVTSTSTKVLGSNGSADNLILDGTVVGSLAVRGVESHANPALTCPLAAETVNGNELIGLSDLDVISCMVDKQIDGNETHFLSVISAKSIATGEEFLYNLYFRTGAALSTRPEIFLFVNAEISNRSLGSSTVRIGKFYDTPPYWLTAFMECQTLFVQACPDHLNGFSDTGVQDIGPGSSSDDGAPI